MAVVGLSVWALAQTLPDGPGKALVEQKCSTCHGLGSVVALKLGENEWDFLVGQMISNGAQVNAEERKQMVVYLATHFGKGAAPAATPPAVDGAKLYAICAGCHGAGGAGSAVFPPLAGGVPEIIKAKGGREYLVQAMLYGLSGQIAIAGKTYSGFMPAWGQLKDEEIAALLNHISSQWGNDKLLPQGHKVFAADEVKAARSKPLTAQQVLEVRKALGLK
jgi:mono/diheme cytochrome c family protein